jgi:arylsulfatase A-like enzyme
MKPNILVIQADQHRYDCLGCTGNPDVRTPNIDAIAHDGTIFESAFCPYPVCTPSRFSFLTGLYVHQHMAWSNHCTIPAGLQTFPKVLREAGYKTKAVGKMHFSPTYLDVGFDEMLLAEQHGAGRLDDDYHRYLREHDLIDEIDLIDQEREYRGRAPQTYTDSLGAMVSNLDEEHHVTTWVGQHAVDTLEQWEGGSNLLMASFVPPHHPYVPPAPWHEMYDPAVLKLLPGYAEHADQDDLLYSRGFFPHDQWSESQLRRVMAYYYASISQIDHWVGQMIDTLRANGLYDDTVIVYNSDHGEYLGYRHMIGKNNRMYEPLIRVPTIIKFASEREADRRSGELVNTTDLAPTVLASAGCEVPGDMAGRNLSEDDEGRSVVFAESSRGREYMARSETRKLLLCEDDAFTCFFDLETDPYETTNLIKDARYQDDIQKLKDALSRWILFESQTPVHLDESAKICDGDNVHTGSEETRQEMAEYMRAKIQPALRR